MAESIITPKPRYLDITAARNTYILSPEASKSDIEDQLNSRQKHLEAMLYVGSNADPQAFADEKDIEAFMWACRTMAEEIRVLTDALISKMREEVENGGVCHG